MNSEHCRKRVKQHKR